MYSAIILLLASFCLTSPITKRSTISANDLVRVYPSTASCDGAPAAGECRNATQAVPNIAAAFTSFGITDFNTQAALVALMLYESGGFKYSINHYPGVPGQGTRNMQSPAFNKLYAHFLASNSGTGITAEAVNSAVAQGPSAILALVNTDRWSFASAAWFLKSQCTLEVQKALATGTQAGWSSYLTQCIGTPATNDRTQVWDRVKSIGRWTA